MQEGNTGYKSPMGDRAEGLVGTAEGAPPLRDSWSCETSLTLAPAASSHIALAPPIPCHLALNLTESSDEPCPHQQAQTTYPTPSPPALLTLIP